MKAEVNVIEKNSEIDGKPINWSVLGISNLISGERQTLELKLNKTEALLANILLNSDKEMTKQIRVIEKNSEIDGKPINWSVLGITSFLEDDFHTLELKLNKTQALVANLLLSSNEKKDDEIDDKGLFKKDKFADDNKISLVNDD